MVKVLVVIPARLGSTRFAGKVLAADSGKFLIQHTYEQASRAKSVEKVIIAADDRKICDAAKTFGAECVLTRTDHQSGTDRIAEATANYDAGIIINVQADEPEIDPGNIDKLAQLMIDNPDCQMATLVAGFTNKEQISDPNIVKVVVDKEGFAIYFSRSVIPCDRTAGVGDIKNYLRHLGIYAYRKDFLQKITKLPQTTLEKIEKLEQLRALENGVKIMTAKVAHTCDGIDTPEQYKEFVKRIRRGH